MSSPLWPLYELGGGGAVRRAARQWEKGQAPWEVEKAAARRRYYDAGANGVAMRILPHAIYGAGDPTFSRVAERIVADGVTTHGHPRALVGALAAGFAMWMALRWKGKVGYGELVDACLEEQREWSELPESALIQPWMDAGAGEFRGSLLGSWRTTTEEMIGLLSVCSEAMSRGSLARDHDVLEELGAFGNEGGSGTRSAAVAVYLASRYVAKPTAGLLAAAFARRADTDTIACLSGAILGALTGDTEVDGLSGELQDARYISQIASQVAEHEQQPLLFEGWDTRAKRHALGELDQGRSIFIPIFGAMSPFDHERPATRSANEIAIWWLHTDLGQSLSITRVKKKKPPAAEKSREIEVGGYSRARQTSIDEIEVEGENPVQSTWTLLFVDDLDEALELYHVLLRIPIRERGATYVVLGRNLVLELSDDPAPQASDFRAPQVIGVYVAPESLPTMHERAEKAGYRTSETSRGRRGERFRICDTWGHVIEVWSSEAGGESV